jgi:hypothetical protein
MFIEFVAKNSGQMIFADVTFWIIVMRNLHLLMPSLLGVMIKFIKNGYVCGGVFH